MNEKKSPLSGGVSVEPRLRVGDALVEMGIVDRGAVESVAQSARIAHRPLGEMLVEGMYIEDADLYMALARQHGRRFVRLDDFLAVLDKNLLARFSLQYLRGNLMLPVHLVDKKMAIVTCRPGLELTDLRAPLGLEHLETWITTPRDFSRAWTHLGLGTLDLPKESEQVVSEAHETFVEADSETVRRFEAILEDAFAERATDIHFETYGERIRLRYRIDGDLHTILKFTLNWRDLAGFVNIVKVQSRLDLAERRRPQGGAMHRVISGHVVDIRVQTQPTLYGENLIMRLLPQTTRRMTIDDLGFHPVVAQRYRRLLESPSGLILVVGPTGSGKTTTIYAALQEFSRDETKKVITIEDPIEYVLAGLQQTQIAPILGYDFANAMRVIVRQDPDVIMLGEIRDPETALETIRASQTGHLVLSTLHCNDAVDAVQRMVDLGMHPNSVGSELVAVIAQRLAPRICQACKQPAQPAERDVAELFPGGAPAEFHCFVGKGCERCGGRGVYGRVAVYEFMEIYGNLRRAIADGEGPEDLRALALQGGMAPLRDVAVSMIDQGLIPLDAVRQILLPERMAPDDPAKPFRVNPFVA